MKIYDDDIGEVQLVQHMGSDRTIVNAARVSFANDRSDLAPVFEEKDKKLIRYLIKNKHTSTLEHCSVTWKVVVPIFVARQFMRHRTWSYNEISRRYTSKDLQFYLPKTFRTQHNKDRQASNDVEIDPGVLIFSDEYIKASLLVKDGTSYALADYEALLEAGVCREQARMVLPQNLYTEFYATANLNNIFKFIVLRDSEHAQKEIQVVAQAMLQDLMRLFPIATEAFFSCQNKSR